MNASPNQDDSYLLGEMRNQVQKAAELIAEGAWLEYRLWNPIEKNAQLLCA